MQLFDTNATQWRDRIAKCGAILEGDFFFLLKSGRIAKKYVNLDCLYPNINLVDMIGREFASRQKSYPLVIAAPAVGAIPLAYAVARAERALHHIDTHVIWADKQQDGTFAFERMSFEKYASSPRIIAVEDIATTGGSVKGVIDAVRRAGGTVLGTHFVWNRGGVTAESLGCGYVHSIIEETIESWEPHEHPLWGKLPLVMDVGHPNHCPNYPGPRINLLTEIAA